MRKEKGECTQGMLIPVTSYFISIVVDNDCSLFFVHFRCTQIMNNLKKLLRVSSKSWTCSSWGGIAKSKVRVHAWGWGRWRTSKVLRSWTCLTLTNSGGDFVGSKKISWFWLSSFRYRNPTYHFLVLLTTSEVCLAGFIRQEYFWVLLCQLLSFKCIFHMRDSRWGREVTFLSPCAVPGSLLGTFYALIHKSVTTTPCSGHYYLCCTYEKTDPEECSNT